MSEPKETYGEACGRVSAEAQAAFEDLRRACETSGISFGALVDLAAAYQPQAETLGPQAGDVAALRAENERLRDLLRKCEPALAFVVVRDPLNADPDLVELWASVREATGSERSPPSPPV